MNANGTSANTCTFTTCLGTRAPDSPWIHFAVDRAILCVAPLYPGPFASVPCHLGVQISFRFGVPRMQQERFVGALHRSQRCRTFGTPYFFASPRPPLRLRGFAPITEWRPCWVCFGSKLLPFFVWGVEFANLQVVGLAGARARSWCERLVSIALTVELLLCAAMPARVCYLLSLFVDTPLGPPPTQREFTHRSASPTLGVRLECFQSVLVRSLHHLFVP